MREDRDTGYVEPCTGCDDKTAIHYVRPDETRMHFVPYPGPTAGDDHHWICGDCGHEGNGPDNAEWYEHTKVCPAVAASTGTSEDVEALARLLAAAYHVGGSPSGVDHRVAAAVLASDWLAARESAARAEERERIVRWLRTGPDYHQRRSEIARHIREG